MVVDEFRRSDELVAAEMLKQRIAEARTSPDRASLAHIHTSSISKRRVWASYSFALLGSVVVLP